jgi:hypothetical protein
VHGVSSVQQLVNEVHDKKLRVCLWNLLPTNALVLVSIIS